LKGKIMSKKTSTFTAENMLFASTIVQQLDGLAVRRKEWETTDYKKANDGLYALLADCLSVYQARFVKGSLGELAIGEVFETAGNTPQSVAFQFGGFLFHPQNELGRPADNIDHQATLIGLG
jgi:hypothetical protein